MEIINKLTEGDSEIKNIYIKNHESIDFKKLQNSELQVNEIKKIGFLKQAIEEILSSKPDALQLFKNLCVIKISFYCFKIDLDWFYLIFCLT